MVTFTTVKRKKFLLEKVLVTGYAAEGKSVARQDGKVYFIEGAVPGDVVDVFISTNKKDWGEGKAIQIHEYAAERTTPFCQHFGVCGGCKWQMLPYEKQLVYKQQEVAQNLKRIGKIELPEILPIAGGTDTIHYRNKLDFTFSNKRYLTSEEIKASGEVVQQNALGFHVPRIFDKIIDIETCYLMDAVNNSIRNFTRDFARENKYTFYDIKQHTGWLRNIIIRYCNTRELMVNICLGYEDEIETKKLLDNLLQKVPVITTLLYTINTKWNDTIYDLSPQAYFGKGFVIEQLGEFKFKIGPKSFFQTNTIQAEKLYNITRDFAQLTGNEIVYDLYCGTGSIGIFVSKMAKKIIGVEAISEAIEDAKEYAVEDADITLQLKNTFLPSLKIKEVEKVFYEVENPLVKVLTDMEFEGIKVDMDFLTSYSKELDIEAKIAEEKVYELAGVRFNLASPKQLGEVLFEKMKLDPKAKKTKTGQYATGEDVLAKLANNNLICDQILSFRELTKLRSTYVEAFPVLMNARTGRVHTNYAQAVAVTGRLSSTNPNLQNIPIRTEKGREIRKAFIPRDADHVLVSADYSQIELRVVAAISGDVNMCEAFKTGKDIHTATAAKVFGVEESEVTKEMRYKAKSVNFGIIYGQGAFGLSENLSIPRAEAKEIIDNYKKEFPGIQKYMDDTINFCKQNGYVETLMGRKRWLKDINSANFTVRGFAERNAINSPIQGTAADMIKLAMIKISAALKEGSFKSKMLLQVHDELVFDVLKEELEAIKPLILESMKSALVLPNEIPADAELGVGNNWLEAH